MWKKTSVNKTKLTTKVDKKRNTYIVIWITFGQTEVAHFKQTTIREMFWFFWWKYLNSFVIISAVFMVMKFPQQIFQLVTSDFWYLKFDPIVLPNVGKTQIKLKKVYSLSHTVSITMTDGILTNGLTWSVCPWKVEWINNFISKSNMAWKMCKK